MDGMLYGVTLSVGNYDSLLTGWNALASLRPNVSFDAGHSRYSSTARNARASIISRFHWTISDWGTTPTVPREVDVARGDKRLSVSWSAPADDGGNPVSGYVATASPGGASCITQD